MEESSSKFKNISDEKRLDIIKSLDNNLCSRKMIAQTLNVSYSSVVKIYGEYCKSGRTKKLKVGGIKPKKLSPEQILFIKELLIEDCSLTLKIIKQRILQKYSISICEATVSNYVDSFNFSIKRISKISTAAITDALIANRKTYSVWFLDATNNCKNIMFFDETGFQVAMRKHYGRSEKGKKAIVITPCIKSRNKTIMACMWRKGLVHYKALDGSGNRFSLLEYMTELCNILSSENICNVEIVMDNASFHRCSEISIFLESKGHSIKFLPPYSPFFNPIEFMFSQWKGIVRGRNPSNDNELMKAIGEFKNILSEEQCENYVKHATNNAIKCLAGINVFEE